jgi:hypothetical protein
MPQSRHDPESLMQSMSSNKPIWSIDWIMREAGDGWHGFAPANANLQSFADAKPPSILSKSTGSRSCPDMLLHA